MHIADGAVPVGLCVAGYALALPAASALGRKLDIQEIPRMGMLAAASFVASLIHFPLAGFSMHLGLYGLLGVLLGRRALPVVFATLLFQALLFQHGGLLTLGLNTVNMGAGALLGWALWSIAALPEEARGFAAGFFGALIPAFLMAFEFSLSGYGKGFYVIAGAYAAVGAVEGLLTAGIVAFFRKMKPEVLERVPV